MAKNKVLHLAKWYPNKEPLLGIFIQKHIQSVQRLFDNKIMVFIKLIQLIQMYG